MESALKYFQIIRTTNASSTYFARFSHLFIEYLANLLVITQFTPGILILTCFGWLASTKCKYQMLIPVINRAQKCNSTSI